MAKVGGDSLSIGGFPVSGTIGVRLGWTRDDTQGATTLPTPFTPTGLHCTRGTDPGPPPRPTASSGCVVTQQEIDFGNGATVADTTKVNHFHALPSFNIKFDLTDKLVSRFAYSRAMSRPDFGLLRNFLTVNRLTPNLNDFSDTNVTRAENGTAIAYDWQYPAQSGNPATNPTTATHE